MKLPERTRIFPNSRNELKSVFKQSGSREPVMIQTLLFIIFGWPKKVKNRGAAYPQYCDHCQNNVFFHLLKVRRWFSLFFIPVIPLGRASWYLTCEICEGSFELTKEEAKDLKPLVEATAQLEEGSISQPEYEQRVRQIEEQIWGESSELTETSEPEVEPKELVTTSQTVEESEDEERTVAISNDRLGEKIAETDPGQVITKREFERLAPTDNGEDWWSETAKPALEESEAIEQDGSTGRRWRVK